MQVSSLSLSNSSHHIAQEHDVPTPTKYIYPLFILTCKVPNTYKSSQGEVEGTKNVLGSNFGNSVYVSNINS